MVSDQGAAGSIVIVGSKSRLSWISSPQPPCGAGGTVTFDNSMSANIRMRFLSVITDPDGHVWVEGANRCGPSCLQRIADNRCEIVVGASIDKTSGPPALSGISSGEARNRGPVRAPLARAGTTTATAARQMLQRTLDLKTARALIWDKLSGTAGPLRPGRGGCHGSGCTADIHAGAPLAPGYIAPVSVAISVSACDTRRTREREKR
jgi:hypothetical protein